jgi:hypothetical protein
VTILRNDISEEILQRLTRVETKLDMFASAKDTANEALQLGNENKRRIDKLERALYWTSAIIIGGVLVSVLNVVLNN